MDAIVRGKLPGNLKLTGVTPLLKKKNPLDTINYRPVSVLSTISEIFGNLRKSLYQNHLSPYLCKYWKGYSTQQALLVLIEGWKIR